MACFSQKVVKKGGVGLTEFISYAILLRYPEKGYEPYNQKHALCRGTVEHIIGLIC